MKPLTIADSPTIILGLQDEIRRSEESRYDHRLHGVLLVVADYLRPAAVKTGVLAKDSPHRFGFHNLRHSLASFLVRTKTDPKTVQSLLRHSNVKTTLRLYAHSVSEDRMAAQGLALEAILHPPASSAVN
jgi:integrase